MSPLAWTACSAWMAAATASAAVNARRGLGEGRGRRARARLTSPTVYLFTAYLVIAGLCAPISPGESASPLLGLGLVLPIGYLLATLSAIGRERRSRIASAGLGLLHGGAVLAAAAVVLAIVSPAYVPTPLK